LSKYVIGITGASGSIYGIRLIQELGLRNHTVDVVITSAGKMVMKEELGVTGFDIKKLGLSKIKSSIRVWENDDFEAPFLSGSNPPEAVVIIPCSMGKLAAVANGISGNVLERTADVVLKERRRLVLLVRETPLHTGHLRTMTRLSEMGAVIAPPVPAFYTRPQTLDDMVTQTVGRALDLFDLEHEQVKRWQGDDVHGGA